MSRARRWWRDLWAVEKPGPKYETWTCPICGRPVEMPSGGPMVSRYQGFYLPPGEPEIKIACGKQHGTHHGRGEKSDLGMSGLEKRIHAMQDWLADPPQPGDPVEPEPLDGGHRGHDLGTAAYDIEFRWKEQVIYWEESQGAVFKGAWGGVPLTTLVPDSATWDSRVPGWLVGRHDQVVARLRADRRHLVREEHDDGGSREPLESVER